MILRDRLATSLIKFNASSPKAPVDSKAIGTNLWQVGPRLAGKLLVEPTLLSSSMVGQHAVQYQ